jgi:hypothetical protein
MQYGTKITIWREQRARSTEQQARVDENFRTATVIWQKEQNGRNILTKWKFFERLEYKK